MLYKNCKSFEKIYDLTSYEINEILSLEKNKNYRKINEKRLKEEKKRLKEYNNYYNRIIDNKIGVLIPSNKLFPKELLKLEDCPIVLYYKGKLELPSKSVAIVGSRRCTNYAKEIAYYLGKELSNYGVNIVSGLAYGVDIEAHKGVIENKGFATAVVAGGLHECYPKDHKKYFDYIKENGLLITETPFGVSSKAYMFRQRNRIISGLSEIIIVVEAAEKSGALITATYGLEQNKEIMTIPNRLFETKAIGSNKLAKDGATIIYELEDVLFELNLKIKENIQTNLKKNEKVLEINEKIVYSFIEYEIIHIEELCRKINSINYKIKKEEINIALISLEIKGYIKTAYGCYYSRV